MSLIRGKIQTDILAIEVAIAAAIWKEGEKDPNWVKRDASGRFSRKSGADTNSSDGGDGKQVPTESKKSLRELAQKQKQIVQDSISNTLERLGLKEKVDKKELEKITELIEPESSSTPEGLQAFTDKLGKMYNDLEDKWEAQPATAKLLVGAMGAVASVVLLHSGIKNASKTYEGIKGFKEADDELKKLHLQIRKSLSLENGSLSNFIDFYEKAASQVLNKSEKEEYKDIFDAISEIEQAFNEINAKAKHQQKQYQTTLKKIMSMDKEDNPEKYRVLMSSYNRIEKKLFKIDDEIEQLEKSAKAARTIMYTAAKDNAERVGATQGHKDFLNLLDEFLSRTKTREEQFGDFIDAFWNAKKPSPTQSLKNKKEANLDYLKEAVGDTIGCIAGLMLMGEVSTEALLSAAQDIADEN